MPIRPEAPASGPAHALPVVRGPQRRLPAVLTVGLLLAGCAAAPPRALTPGEEARRVLAEQRAAGPIRTVVRGNPFGMDETRLNALVSEAMAQGVAGLAVGFTTWPDAAAAPEPHLVVAFDALETAPAEAFCSTPDAVPTTATGDTLDVLAVFCQGDEVIHVVHEDARVAGPTDRAFQRLLWRTAGALFPDDYAETYGFGFLPRWLNLGVGGSTGL